MSDIAGDIDNSLTLNAIHDLLLSVLGELTEMKEEIKRARVVAEEIKVAVRHSD